jgi:methylthioribose-1-phosphate isomerase
VSEIVPLRLIPGAGVDALDQTLLPHDIRYIRLATVDAVCEAIVSLRVRGAPLLGLVGAAGLAVAAESEGTEDAVLAVAAERIASARPTAVDLRARTAQALRVALGEPPETRTERLWAFAEGLLDDRVSEDRRIGEFGAVLLQPGAAVLTHCNTGALATGGIGTALGVIRVAWEQGKLAHCYATETRPLLQGARLTAWELRQLGIPASLLPDTAAASLIASGKVGAILTGADRIAANGDTANKVGTYGLAAVAARHEVPFYVAAPTSTIDLACASGSVIPIEFRVSDEVGGFGGERWSPEGLGAYNPAFDVTPADLIAAIITERGVARPPYGASISGLFAEQAQP